MKRGHLQAAEMAAREMGSLSLSDALSLCLLLERENDPQWDRAFNADAVGRVKSIAVGPTVTPPASKARACAAPRSSPARTSSGWIR